MRIQTVLILTAVLFMVAVCHSAQDSGFVRDWEEAQKHRPTKLSSSSSIADAAEPGTPLHIRGRVYLADGATPAPGVTVFAWQTDRDGAYNERGERGWRLRGWARTAEDGSFAFRTIRPGPYPGGSTPAHVHFTIEGPDLPRRWTSELLFDGDPLVSTREMERSSAAGTFGWVRTVRRGSDGIEVVNINLRASEDSRF